MKKPKTGEMFPEESSTKKRILTAALAEFSEFGLAGARVDRIAQKAGVNKAMIYYHFSSKKALHQEVIKQHFSRILTAAGQAVTVSDHFEDLLKSFTEVYAAAFSINPEFVRIFLHEMADSEGANTKMIADMIAGSGLPKQIVSSFQTGIEQGHFRPVDVRQTFVSFILMNVGYFILAPIIDKIWDVTDRDQFVSERKEAVIDLFLYGVKMR